MSLVREEGGMVRGRDGEGEGGEGFDNQFWS